MSFKKGDWVVIETLKSVRDPEARFGRRWEADGWTFPFEVVRAYPDEQPDGRFVLVDTRDERGEDLWPVDGRHRKMRKATKEDFDRLIEHYEREKAELQEKIEGFKAAQDRARKAKNAAEENTC